MSLGDMLKLEEKGEESSCSLFRGFTVLLKWTQCTVEPLNKGHFGANSFVPCREVVLISEVK